MNKIIKGKRYDTETAVQMAEWDNGQYRSFNFMKEVLYRKRTGEYFIYGEGGPRTRYAELVDNNLWSDGSAIRPVSLEEAQKWAEEHLTADEYEEIFGTVEESTEKRTVTFSLTEATIEKIARIATEKGITKSEVIEQLLKQ